MARVARIGQELRSPRARSSCRRFAIFHRARLERERLIASSIREKTRFETSLPFF